MRGRHAKNDAASGLPRLIVAPPFSPRRAARFEALHANRDEASPAAAAQAKHQRAGA